MGDHSLAWPGALLHACGEMDGFAHNSDEGIDAALRTVRNDFARTETDAHLRVLAASVGAGMDFLSSQAAADGVILLSQRRAEDGQYTVSHYLRNGSAIAADAFASGVKRIEQSGIGVFWVQRRYDAR